MIQWWMQLAANQQWLGFSTTVIDDNMGCFVCDDQSFYLYASTHDAMCYGEIPNLGHLVLIGKI